MSTKKTDNESIRLNRYIASSGFCSRRQADEYIQDNRVTIDGKSVQMGQKVFPGQVVRVDNKPIFPEDDLIYIMLHKPTGITCTTDPKDPDNVISYIGHDQRIFPIGRLDKMSTGLLLLTNDGSIVNAILRAEGRHEKEYYVEVDKPFDASFITSMQSGVPILDTVTRPCKIVRTGKKTFKIILTQGLNRQIRRMCEYHGYRVKKLKRIRIMNITLGNLPLGQWRSLKPKELRDLKKILYPSQTGSNINVSG